MPATIETRPLLPADEDACEELVLELPYRFGEQTGMHEILEAVRDQEGIVADVGGALSGFLTWDRPDPRSALITWLAARPEERAATERALVEAALEAFAAAGAELACVVVPGPSRADDAAPSQRTLYETLGFVALCEVPSLDEWTEVSVVLARALTR